MEANKLVAPTMVFLVAFLSSCGGGSGASSNTASSAPTQSVTAPGTPTVIPADLQTAVPAPTYAAGSQELAFFTALNDFRAKLGLGLLAQNAALDASNKNHLNYMLSNSDVNFSTVDPATGVAYMHEEDPARPGYTGKTSLDRAKVAQYAGTWVGEEVTYGLGNGAATSLGNLIASVYHRQGLMVQSPKDFGLSAGNDRFQTTVLALGLQGTGQHNASDYFGVYPADKQTGVALTTYPELPNPYPELTPNDYATKTSNPISVASEASTTLSVDTFTVTEAGQTAVLDTRLLTAANDPAKLLGKNIAFLVGKTPFKPKTTYDVVFQGSVNGTAVNKSWSFTTAQ